MSTIETSGYLRDNQGVFIPKDRLARLTYTMNWQFFLPPGDSIDSVEYDIQQRTNDANPIVVHDQGVLLDQFTFVEISGGTVGRLYTITADVLTANGLRDRRNFRVKIENRSA